VSVSDYNVTISTEVTLGDLVDQLYHSVIDDIPTAFEVEAFTEIVKLICANYSGNIKYPDLVEAIFLALEDDFIKFDLVELPTEI